MMIKQTGSEVQMSGFESGCLLAVQSWESNLTSLSLRLCHSFEECNPYVIELVGGFSEVRYTSPEHITGNAVRADNYY